MMPSRKSSRRRTSTSGSVDIHCHVFNARDVPVRKFVELVYLEKYPGGSLLDRLIDFIELVAVRRHAEKRGTGQRAYWCRPADLRGVSPGLDESVVLGQEVFHLAVCPGHRHLSNTAITRLLTSGHATQAGSS